MTPERKMRLSLPALRAFSLLLAAVSLLVVMGCRGDEPFLGDPSLVLEVGISPTPPGIGPARLIITLHDTTGNPIEGARVRVEGNMSHAGMAPVLDSAIAEGEGRYTVPAFSFTMAGDWILTLTAELPDGRVTQVQKVTGVTSRPPGAVSPGENH